MRRAVIDLGTNSALLLIADLTPDGKITIVDDRAEICRLGEGLHESSVLRDSARTRVVDVLKTYKAICDSLKVESVTLVGTEACRRAQNISEFQHDIVMATGWTLEVLSPQDEAKLAYAAAYRDFEDRLTTPPLVVDPGGGSTEFIYRPPSGDLVCASIPIGSVVLSERFLKHDPPLPLELQALGDSIDIELKENLAHFPKQLPIVALAGTATSLAAIDLALEPYDGARVQGYRLTLDKICAINARLAALSLAGRKRVPGLHPKRADVILSGTLLVEKILRFFEVDYVWISDRGVRYGMLYSLFEI